MPPEVCAAYPAIRDYGIYRELNSGQKEFVSICTQEITLYLSIYNEDLNNLLKELPE